jgi:hypothetical protein
MKNLRQTKKDITGYYGDGRGNFYTLYKDGSKVAIGTRVLAKSNKNKAK